MSIADVSLHVLLKSNPDVEIRSMSFGPGSNNELWYVTGSNQVYRFCVEDEKVHQVQMMRYGDALHAAQFTHIMWAGDRLYMYDGFFMFAEKWEYKSSEPNTIRYELGHQTSSRWTHVVCEMCPYGTLSDVLHGMSDECALFSWDPLLSALMSWPDTGVKFSHGSISGMAYNPNKRSLLLCSNNSCDVSELLLDEFEKKQVRLPGTAAIPVYQMQRKDVKQAGKRPIVLCGKPHRDASRPFSQDGSLSQARFRRPTALTLDAHNNIYVMDELDHSIKRIDEYRTAVTTVAGNCSSKWMASASEKQRKYREHISRDVPGGRSGMSLAHPKIMCMSPTGDLWVHCFRTPPEREKWSTGAAVFQIRSFAWETMELREAFMYMVQQTEYAVLNHMPMQLCEIMADFAFGRSANMASTSSAVKSHIRQQAQTKVNAMFCPDFDEYEQPPKRARLY